MNLKLHLGVIVCLAAVGGLLITTFHAVVQEEVIIVNVLPADFSWENAKPIMLELRGIAPNTRVAFWTWEGHGNFGSMGEMKGNTVFLTELSGNYTLSFSAPKKLRIESLSKWDALQLPSSDWRVCGVRTFASLFSGNATGEVKIAFNTGFYNLSLDGNLSLYSTYQQNITGYSRAPNPKIQERYADGVIIRGNGSYTLTVERLPDVEEQNLPPVAALPFEKLVVAEGMNTHLEGIAYDPDGFITNKTWDFGDGKNGSGVSVVHSWQAAGNYTLGFSVQDSNNTVSTTHAWIEVQPAPPQLQVKSEQETSNSFTFTANASKNCQFFWYFGDGDTGYGGTVTHTYSHSGDYTVVVKAISEDGTWNTTSLTVKVENAPPVAAANGPYYGLEGDTVVLNGSMEDEDVSSCNYYWTVGGENYFVNPLNYTFEDDFNGNVAFTVIDNGGLVATDKALVVINNTAPVILSLNASFVVNISYRIAGEKWHDSSLHVYGDGIEVLNLTVYRVPGQPDVEVARGLVLDATKNWSFYADCSFEDDVVNGNENGASPVWLNISFGDSCELLHHTFVWSPGHKDTEWRGFLNPLLHRHPVLLQAYARDRGNDVLAFAWDFGDGNSTVHFYQKEGRDIVRHVYSQPGNYCVKLTVEDDEGAVDTATLCLKWEGYGVSVPNLPPVADFVIWNGANESVSEILEGTEVWLISNAYDPEYQPISVFWFFGDGTASSELVNRKVYNAGVYNITLYVSDGYTTSVATKTLRVKNALPAVTIEGITDCTEGFAYYYNANVSAAITDWNLEYQWALNGMPVGNRNTTRIMFSTAGTYRLTLTVSDDEGSLVSAELFVNVSEFRPEIFYVSEMELYTNTVVLAPAVFDTPSDYANLTVTYKLVRFNDTVVNAVVGSGRVFEYNATVKGTGTHEIAICVSDGHATACLNLTLRLHCDSDSDGMPDEWEWKYGLNWRTDDSKGDADADGLTNLEEYRFCTDPGNPDTDNDGLSDDAEVKEWLLQPHEPDCDEDGLNDSTEVLGLFYYGNYRLNIVLLGSESERNASLPLLPGIYSCTIFGNATSTTNLVVTAGNTSTVFNVSGDFNCSFRFAAETLTFSITNNTTVLLSNATVYRIGSNPKCRHSDYDMLSDAEEYSRGLSPVKNDTDDDGVWDRAEEELGLDPLNPDFDGDNATDGIEVYYGTDPFRKNTDKDELDDGLELAFVPLYVFTASEMRSATRNPGNATITVKLPDEFIYKVSIVLAGALPSVYLNGTEVTLDVIGNTAVHAFHGYAGNLTVSIDGDFQSCTVLRFGINPFGEDYDNDGLNDSAEVYFNSSPFFKDTDEDGLNDSMEYNFRTNPRSNDTDSDGLSDYEEVMLGLNPLEADTDGDGFSDGAEFKYWNKTLGNATESALRCKNPDVDNDSMPDGWEIQNGLNLTSDDASGDADNDGLSNVGEWNLDANPEASDTDGDGLSDGAEVGNCSFRTNIAEGARSIGNYSNSSGWIWWNWSKYVFSNETAWNETPELLFALGDGGIYINRTGNKLIIVSGLENGRVNTTHVVYKYAGVWSENNLTKPLPGYKHREIFEGTSPTSVDTDADGVYDLDNGIWDNKTDYDSDNATDGREVYTVYRESLSSSAQKWIAVDTNWSDTYLYLSPALYSGSGEASYGQYDSENAAKENISNAVSDLGRCYGGNTSYIIGNTYQNLPILYTYNASQPLVRYLVCRSIYIQREEGDGGKPAWYIYIGYDIYNATSYTTLPFLSLEPYAKPEYSGEGKEVHLVLDTDADSLPDLGDPDSDNDGIKDGDEPLYWLDTDRDGRVNMRDTDSDNDGLNDSQEDINCNGKLDAWESSPISEDTDNDGLNDSLEWNRYFTNPSSADTDGDGLTDKEEVNENVWWYRQGLGPNERLQLLVMPNSNYLLYVWANSTGDIGMILESGQSQHAYTIRNARPGDWYQIQISHNISPTAIKVTTGAIRQFVFVAVENATHYSFNASLKVRTQGNATVQIPIPSSPLPLRCFNATYKFEIPETTPTVYLLIGLVENTTVFYAMRNGTTTQLRTLPDFSSEIDKYCRANNRSVNITLNKTFTNWTSEEPWAWFNFSVEFQPYFTNPFVADSDNDSLSDKLELKYGTNPFCNDTDHDGLADINETGRFVDEVRDNSPDWNNSSQHSPGIYFNDLNETIGTGKNVSATANFNFTVDVTGLSPEKELPKPVTVTAILQGQLPKEYFVVSSYYGVLYDENNNTIASESKEDWNDSYAVLTFRFDFNATTTTRYYVSIIWNYSILADKPERYPPRIDITLKFGEKETTTDPLDVDTDHDCVADGADTNPFDPSAFPESPFADNDGDGLLNWEEENIGTDKNKADTDGDGLSDYEEVMIYRTDPKNADMDNDGLTDFEEIKIYHTVVNDADPDRDGLTDYQEVKLYRTDPNKASSDSDNLTDSQEIFITHTDPWKEDTDGDGLYDDTEYTLGLNPLSNDTDSDQWLDAQEFQYWKSKGLSDTKAARNCKTPDVDGDSITDYQEVFGYTVKVITGWDANNTPISKEITMYGNPLAAYKQTDGRWTDTDEDGIPDIVEIYFSNISYIDSDSLWHQMIVSNGFASTYGWCREYYQTLNASDPSKAENWTQKAFNPFVVCNLPPMITSFSAEAHDEWGWVPVYLYGVQVGVVWSCTACYITVSLEAKSVSGFRNLFVGVKDLYRGATSGVFKWIESGEQTAVSYTGSNAIRLDVDYGTLVLYGYEVYGYVVSYAIVGESHPAVEVRKEIKGIITLVADAIASFLAMLAGGLQEVWNAVEKAVNAIVEWVKNKVEEMVRSVLDSIRIMMDGYLKTLEESVRLSRTELEETGKITEKSLKEFTNILETLLIACGVLGGVIFIIGTFITPFTVGIGNIITMVVTTIALLIVTKIIERMFEVPMGKSIAEIATYVYNLFERKVSEKEEDLGIVRANEKSIPSPHPMVSMVDWLIWYLTVFAATSSAISILLHAKGIDPVTYATVTFGLSVIVSFVAILIEDYAEKAEDKDLLKREILVQGAIALVAGICSALELILYKFFIEANSGAKIISLLSLILSCVAFGWSMKTYMKIEEKEVY